MDRARSRLSRPMKTILLGLRRTCLKPMFATICEPKQTSDCCRIGEKDGYSSDDMIHPGTTRHRPHHLHCTHNKHFPLFLVHLNLVLLLNCGMLCSSPGCSRPFPRLSLLGISLYLVVCFLPHCSQVSSLFESIRICNPSASIASLPHSPAASYFILSATMCCLVSCFVV